MFGRDEAAPKPSPDGVLRLLARWAAAPGEAVMVGDYVFDVLAGRSAGTAMVYVHPGTGEPSGCVGIADLVVPDLGALFAPKAGPTVP